MKFSEYDLVELLTETEGVPKGRSGLIVGVCAQPEVYEVEILGVNGAPSRFVTLPPEKLKLLRRWKHDDIPRHAPRKLERGELLLTSRFLWELGKLMFRGRLPTGKEAKSCLRAYGGRRLRRWREGAGWSLQSSFSGLGELEGAAEELENFFRWLQGRPQWNEKPWAGHHAYSPKELPWENVQLGQRAKDRPAELLAQGEEAIRTYRAFYRLAGDGFSQKELEDWARLRWDWETMPGCPTVWRGEERLPGSLLAGIGLERGVVSFAGMYELLRRLNLPVRGRPERFAALGADGVEYAFSYDFFQEVPVGKKRTRRVWHLLRGGERLEGRQAFRWWERGPVLPLWESRNIRKDSQHYTWTPVAASLTGLRFEVPAGKDAPP